MSGSRPSVRFGEDVDLTGFTPKTGAAPAPIAPETVRRLADENGFPSRAPALPSPPPAIAQRPVKTGRTVLLNARITQRAHDRFHEIVAAEQARYAAGEIMHRVTLGEIVERALKALEREMKGQGT